MPQARTRTYDPTTGIGWPRPLAQVMGGDRRLPAPYLARSWIGPEGLVFDGALIDTDRGEQVQDRWACQVCGHAAGHVAYAALNATSWANRAAKNVQYISGGPLCSMTCARLTVRVCPHFRGAGVIVSFTRDQATWPDDGTTEIALTAYALVCEV